MNRTNITFRFTPTSLERRISDVVHMGSGVLLVGRAWLDLGHTASATCPA
jgi:hypothetical protein